jgi:uncharacterized protein YaaR (DUF327 family)
MIDINPTSPKKDDKVKVKSKKRTKSVEHGNTFINSLEKTIKFDFQGTIDELLNDLKDQEREFLEKQSSYELNRYKSLVKKILKTILDEGYHTKKLKQTKKNRADFLIIDKINDKLTAVSTYITSRNNKAFNLLREIEEIRGLIFDLLS